jgi:hypothetical protein
MVKSEVTDITVAIPFWFKKIISETSVEGKKKYECFFKYFNMKASFVTNLTKIKSLTEKKSVINYKLVCI